MKSLLILGSFLCMILTAVEPLWAADEASSVRVNVGEEETPMRLSDLNMHLNPQIGLSSFEYSGKTGGGHAKFTGGSTVEFGGNARKFETGLLLMQTGADVTLNNGESKQINVTYLTFR